MNLIELIDDCDVDGIEALVRRCGVDALNTPQTVDEDVKELPLYYAARSAAPTHLIAGLLELGATPQAIDKYDIPVIWLAVHDCTENFERAPLQALLNAGVHADELVDVQYRATPLMMACRHSVCCTTMLLKYGASHSATDIYRQTPLHHVARLNDVSGALAHDEVVVIARMLLDSGASRSVRDDLGRTPSDTLEFFAWTDLELAARLRKIIAPS